jgi:hypothetical protein
MGKKSRVGLIASVVILWVLALVTPGFQGAATASAQGNPPGFVWQPLSQPTPAPVQSLPAHLTGSQDMAVRAYSIYEWGIALRAGDLNGDGWSDVAFTTDSGHLRIWMQDPSCHELREQADQFIATSPNDLAVGDLDGDGDDDVVVVAGEAEVDSPGGLYILYQEPAGLATTPITYEVGGNPLRVSMGDISGDGRMDLAVSSLHNLDVLVQQPDGTFVATILADPAAEMPRDVAIADLNHDGRNDIALQDIWNHSDVIIYLRRADGSGFAQGTLVPLPTETVSADGMAVGDVTGDGRDDILVTIGYNMPQASIAVYAQLPGGGFAAPIYVPAYDLPANPVLADWNRDGLRDLVVLNRGWDSFSVHLQQPGGGLGSPTVFEVGDTQMLYSRPMDVADVTGDGAVDVAYLSYLDGLFLASESPIPDCPDPALPPAGRAPSFLYGILLPSSEAFYDGIAAGDITGDGLQDFVVIEDAPWDAPYGVRVIPQQADGTFAKGPYVFDGTILASPITLSGLSLGDLNGDGRLDVSAIGDSVVIAYQQTDGTFETTQLEVGTGPRAFTGIADWTGDGRNDLGVLADAWYVLPQQPDGTLGPPVQYLSDQIDSTGLSNMGDWNGDGKMDLYAWWLDESDANTRQATAMRIFVQQGDGSFLMQTAPCPGPDDLQMGDVTGDGRPDLVLSYTRNAPWASVWVLPQQPDGRVGERMLVSAPLYQMPGGLGLGDLNGDGRRDVLVLNSWLYFSVLLQNAAGYLNPPLIYKGVATLNTFYSHRVASIDANQDGIPEVIGVASPDHYLLFLKPLAYGTYLPLVGNGWRP